MVDDGSPEAELATVLDAWRAQPVTALRAAKRAVDTGLAPLTAAAQEAPVSPSSDRHEMTRRVRDFLAGGRTRRAPRGR